jgi:S1-C subfamily serine protease
VDYSITPLLSIRVVQADYFYTRHGLNIPGITPQNNFRVAAGVVFNLGRREYSPTRNVGQSRLEAPAAAAVESRFGVRGKPAVLGFLVSAVISESPAARLGVNPGDIVHLVDGNDIHTAADLDRAVAANTSGTLSVEFYIAGNWAVDRTVSVLAPK